MANALCLQIINFSRKFPVYAHYLPVGLCAIVNIESRWVFPPLDLWKTFISFGSLFCSVQRIWLTVAAKYCAASQPDNKQQNKFMFSAGCFHGLVSRFGKTEKAGHTWLFTTKSSGSNLKPRAVPTLFPYFSPARLNFLLWICILNLAPVHKQMMIMAAPK